jgi:hypothetical protein
LESRNVIVVLIMFGGVAGLVAAFYLIPGQPEWCNGRIDEYNTRIEEYNIRRSSLGGMIDPMGDLALEKARLDQMYSEIQDNCS